MLDDWTNAGFDPFASPAETDKPFGVKAGSNTDAVTRRRVTAARMVGVPGDEPIRTDATHPINRMFADVAQDEPEIHAEPGFEDEVCAFNLFAYLSRSDVTWNPSVVSASARTACTARRPRSTSCRSSTATTGSSGSCSCRDEITGTWRTATPGAPRAKVAMGPGDVAAMPGDIRHQGYSPSARCCWCGRTPRPSCPS